MAEAHLEGPLQTIAAQSKSTTPDHAELESSFQTIANALRAPTTVTTRSELGKTELPESLAAIWKSMVGEDNTRPTGSARTVLFELLRVAANLCNDNDANRQRLLDVGLIQRVLSTLDTYGKEGLDLQLEDLKVAKTAIGFLLNASMKNNDMRKKMIELDTPTTVLRLSSEIYPVGSWTKTVSGEEEPETWTWRSGLSSWTRRLIDSLNDLEPAPEFKPSCLAYLIKPLDIFAAHGTRTPTHTGSKSTEPSPPDLIATDLETLEAACMLIESLTLDSHDIRLALASGPNSIRTILKFIEFAQSLPDWRTADTTGKERARWEKTLGLCKGAVIRAIVAIAGEDDAVAKLWDESEPLGGWFVAAMLAWIRQYRSVDPAEARDDLVICATLALGNLARRDEYCIALVAPPSSIVPDLVPFITPATDMKVKHGVLGLLKHLAQPAPNKSVLGDAGVLEALASSNVWDSESDRAEAVQASAVGIAKHLCLNNATNTIRLVLPQKVPTSAVAASPTIDHDESDDDTVSGMDQVINLSQRSDTVSLKSEAARVLVNGIKSLWSPGSPEEVMVRKQAVRRLSNRSSAKALAELVGRSRKFPVLLNEGIVALTLLGSQPGGAPYVISVFDRALDVPMALVTGVKPSPDQGAIEHPKLLDMLKIILKNEDKSFPPQLRANVCTLFGSVSSSDGSMTKILDKVKTDTKPILSSIIATEQEEALQAAAKKILDLWAES